MKFINLCKSIFITCLQKNKLLSVMAILISCLAVYCFLGAYACFLNGKVESELNNLEQHIVVPDQEKTDELASTLKNMPGILVCEPYGYILYYQNPDGSPYDLYLDPIVKYPDSLEGIHYRLKASYKIISGRDYTEEELKTPSDSIILSEELGFKVGDKITLIFDKTTEEYTVIGIADNSILPYSYYQNHSAEHGLIKFVFERDLTQEERSALEKLCVSYIVFEKDEDGVVFVGEYIIAIVLGVLVSLFSALQVFGIFLYMFAKVKYNFRIMRITGCKKRRVIAITLIIVSAFAIISLILCICLFPLFLQLLMAFNMTYIPVAADMAVSFLIYLTIVLLSTLPGINALSEKILDERGELS